MKILRKIARWFGSRKYTPAGELACTPKQAVAILADCWADDAHEDELFYKYQALCEQEGREFSFSGFFAYAGEHWNRPGDAYGYQKAWQENRPHDYGVSLDRLRGVTE